MATEETEGKGAKADVNAEARRADHRDLFVTRSLFPNAAAVFTSPPASLSEAKDAACVVLDTNALLVPYGIGGQSLSAIESTYRRLIAEKRLIIPAQVAREFARNRVTKLTDLHQKLSRRRSQLQAFHQGSYPLLENLAEYRRLRDVENQLDRLVTDYRNLLAAVIDHINGWEWNDPVSVLYGRLFQTEIVVDTVKPLDEVRAEHTRRFSNKIPPGYKDEAKDDGGIGDLLIWLTILELGAARRASVMFVSGEEKADWWHRSEQQPLYPRFELVDEFRRASGGCSFHIIRFSRLLELFGASTEVVAEVREEERLAVPEVPLTTHGAMHLRGIQAEQSVAAWLIQSGYKVSPAPARSRYDYIVEGPEGVFAVDVMYARNTMMVHHRLRQRQEEARTAASDLPLTIVVAAEGEDAIKQAERIWAKLDPPFRLCTGTLAPDGRFQVVRPL